MARRKGFTLIELMIVVAIIGVMSAIAIPSLLRFACRAKQSEAKELLKGMYLIEMAYDNEFGGFLTTAQLTSFGGMDPKSLSGAKYYTLNFVPAGGTFVGTAHDTIVPVNPPGTVDEWVIAEGVPHPLNLIDRCMQ